LTTEDSITDVPGISVGHAEVAGGASGCTVILGPFRGRVDRRGPATGSRELDVLGEAHPVPRADALVLTGGSAFGLATVDGVMQWLEREGRGYGTRAGPVPIVPAAVIYDLAPDRPRPGPEDGFRACASASSGSVAGGRVGAGAGATVGKWFGLDASAPGGVGSAAMTVGPWTVGALVVVNAVGDVVSDGKVVGTPRSGLGEDDLTRAFLEDPELRGGFRRGRESLLEGENTTLAVVATDAPLDGAELARFSRASSTALARRISPVHTPFDGDLTFGVSTSDETGPVGSMELLPVGIAGRTVLERAILRAVGADEGTP